MIKFTEIGKIIYDNIQWIFSGIGVTLLSILGGEKVIKRIKNKQIAKNQAVNISSTNGINSENIVTQTSGDNA